MEGFEGHPEAEGSVEYLERELRKDQLWGLQSGAGRFVEWRTGSGGDQEEGLRGDPEAGTKMEVREGG